jgi:hypothetical protein
MISTAAMIMINGTTTAATMEQEPGGKEDLR